MKQWQVCLTVGLCGLWGNAHVQVQSAVSVMRRIFALIQHSNIYVLPLSRCNTRERQAGSWSSGQLQAVYHYDRVVDVERSRQRYKTAHHVHVLALFCGWL